MSDIPADAIRETWDSAYEKSIKLASMIDNHCRETGERFDVMVVVPRGGYYPVNIISRELGFGPTDLIHACIGTYKTASATRNNFELGQMPTAKQVAGKNILVIEEVCDTGHTLDFLTYYLKKAGAGLVRTAVLHYKPGKSETGYKPDWACETTEQWVIYPWEVHEQSGLNPSTRTKS